MWAVGKGYGMDGKGKAKKKTKYSLSINCRKQSGVEYFSKAKHSQKFISMNLKTNRVGGVLPWL